MNLIFRCRDNPPVKAFLIIFFLYFNLSGCTPLFGLVSPYDPTTYKNLTDLKPEVVFLYETFGDDPVDQKWVGAVRLRFAQIYEYEKGKGPKNRETAEQIRMIREMFDRHLDDRVRNGPWGEAHLRNQVENISGAIDIAIQTERLKNRNE